jgi:hypothetical protein
LYLVAQRIKWFGKINRMEDLNPVKKITVRNYIEVRTKRRPKNKWRDEAINDV